MTTLEVSGWAGEDLVVAEVQHLGDRMSLKQTTSRGKSQDVCVSGQSPDEKGLKCTVILDECEE